MKRNVTVEELDTLRKEEKGQGSYRTFFISFEVKTNLLLWYIVDLPLKGHRFFPRRSKKIKMKKAEVEKTSSCWAFLLKLLLWHIQPLSLDHYAVCKRQTAKVEMEHQKWSHLRCEPSVVLYNVTSSTEPLCCLLDTQRKRRKSDMQCYFFPLIRLLHLQGPTTRGTTLFEDNGQRKKNGGGHDCKKCSCWLVLFKQQQLRGPPPCCTTMAADTGHEKKKKK